MCLRLRWVRQSSAALRRAAHSTRLLLPGCGSHQRSASLLLPHAGYEACGGKCIQACGSGTACNPTSGKCEVTPVGENACEPLLQWDLHGVFPFFSLHAWGWTPMDVWVSAPAVGPVVGCKENDQHSGMACLRRVQLTQ